MPNESASQHEPTPLQVSAAELDRRTRVALRQEYDRTVAAARDEDWLTECALYTRESDPESLVGEAPINQLRTGLQLLMANGALPPWENVYFENESATAISVRAHFQDLLERAMAGEFRIIGAYLSNRLFRNADEASAVRTQLARRGVKLVWLGKPTGMDERDPNLWLLERNADTQDEYHSRNTGWLVGRQLEYKTRKGEPIGHLPECWRIIERAPGHRPGHSGRPIRWELAEPVASIVREGAEKFLNGRSLREVARWSSAGPLGGMTPAGRVMDWVWWGQILKNPKIAGLQEAIRYPGYFPKGTPRKDRPRRVRGDLVPCLLPPLITEEQWREIIALGRKRHAWGGKGDFRARDDHRVELLSGIAYDARCGHQVHTTRHEGDDYYVRCSARGIERHGSIFRARHAGATLEDLVGEISFDEDVVEDVVRALRARAAAENPERETVPPAVLKLRSVIATLRDDPDLAATRRSLEEQLRALEAERPRSIGRNKNPEAIFARAVASLDSWRETWAQSSIEDKNRVLRAAGLRAYIEPIEQQHVGRRKDVPPYSRLVRIEADVPEFALALAVGTGMPVDGADLGPRRSTACTSIGRLQIGLPREYLEMLESYSLEPAA